MSDFIYMPARTIDDSIMTSDVPENDAPVYNPATTYNTGDPVMYDHRVYESAIDGNVGNTPFYRSKTPWLDIGPTNRYAAFDLLNTTMTEQAESITFTFTLAEIITGVWLFDVEAQNVQVIVNDTAVGGDGEVYNTSKDMQDNSGITDWDTYFFSPIINKRAVGFADLPFYYNTEIQVIISNPGSIAKVGSLAIGWQHRLGLTLQGTVEGIEKLSVITRDSIDGNVNITSRDYLDEISYPVSVNTPEIPRIKRILTDNRDRVAVFAGALFAEDTIVLGLYDSFRITRGNALLSDCSLDVKGIAS